MTTTSRHGTVETREGLTVIRFQRRLAHPVERVWQALTDPQRAGGVARSR